MEKAAEQIYPVVEFQLRKKSTCFCKRVEALVIPRISGAWGNRYETKLPWKSNQFEGPLSADELNRAEEHLVREVQMQHFRKEINMLNRKETLKNSKLYSLRPYLDDQGILRINSRFNESKFHSNEKNPIIIPKESKFAVLIVKEKHLRLLHGGVTLTLSQIRRKYWIPQAIQLIRKIINKCLACKKYSVKSAYPDSCPVIESRNHHPLLSLVLTSRALFTSN
ncbi:uncharacterized protein TNCT_240851 [Trichonephila clavata]|uniref:Integrase zinc-binding domain-containing protein n=1 Tax=Trichonephila clavata TaxID=2740835 RepID=A0A8X6G454_TRICU|nr:uncharacterized protein TNCT_240851 [Trichonephila clavata]